MHENEVRADIPTMTALIAEQFPRYGDLPITQFNNEGTDHVLFRIGDELLARMPKIDWAVGQATTDAEWMARLAPQLPVPVPITVEVAEPGAGYPWPWSLVRWIDGDNPTENDRANVDLATDLADFALALHAIDPTDGPAKAPGSRGSDIADAAEDGREAIEVLRAFDDLNLDLDRVSELWERIVEAPRFAGPPTWLHGDLMPGNILVRQGKLAGVIDFLRLGVGDPAPDVGAAWWTFDGAAKQAYLERLAPDSSMLLRGAGWVLLPALTGIDYYRSTWPDFARRARESVQRLLADPDLQ